MKNGIFTLAAALVVGLVTVLVAVVPGNSSGDPSDVAHPPGPTTPTSRVAPTPLPLPLGRPLQGHTDPVESVTFSPDGKTLASGSDDHAVRLWDISTPTRAHPLGDPLTGHTEGVGAVAFSPDGRTLASGSDDHTVRLWDTSDPTRPRLLGDPLTGHAGWVSSVAFSPDGRTLASGSYDHTVWLWDTSDPTRPAPACSSPR